MSTDCLALPTCLDRAADSRERAWTFLRLPGLHEDKTGAIRLPGHSPSSPASQAGGHRTRGRPAPAPAPRAQGGAPRLCLALLALAAALASPAAAQTDGELLLGFKASFGASGEKALASWAGKDPCGGDWLGVVCTEGRVTAL